MARPFAWIGFTFFAVLFTAALYGRAAAAVLALLGGITLIFSFILFILKKGENKRRSLAVLGAVIIIAVGWISFYTRLSFTPALNLADKRAAVQAEITDVPVYQYSRWYYSVNVKSVNGQECNIPLRFSSAKAIDAEPYDIITAEMFMYELGEDSEETKIKYKSKGIVIGGYAVNPSTVKVEKTENKPFKAHILNFRQWIKIQLKSLLPGGEGALLQGMLLGDKSAMTAEEKSDFRTVGTSHLMAVSGLHFSIWLSALMWFLKRLSIPQKLRPFIGIIFVLFFMALTGFTASVIRAGVMMIIVLAGQLFGKQADSLNSLGLAAVIILLENPYAVLDLGFLLSFFATAGILIMSPVLLEKSKSRFSSLDGKKAENFIMFCAETICITVSAILFTLPVQVFFIGEFSLIAPISNLLMTNVGGAAMVLAGVAVLFSGAGILSFLKYPLAFIAGISAKYLLWIARVLSQIPYAQVRVDLLYVKLWVIVTVILFVFSIFVMRRNKVFLRMTAAASVVFLIIGTASYEIVHHDETEISILDVGAGISVLVTHDGKAAIIGCGGDYFTEYRISNALEKNGIKEISLLLVPREQETESSAAGDILLRCKVKYLISSYDDEQFNVISKSNRKISESGKILLWDNTTLQYINKGNQSAALLTVDETKILFSFCPETKLSSLAEEWYCADALICRGAVPKDAPSYTITVVSGNSKITPVHAAEYKERSSGAVLITAGEGSVEILTKGDKKVSAGRENNGLYRRKRIKATN